MWTEANKTELSLARRFLASATEQEVIARLMDG